MTGTRAPPRCSVCRQLGHRKNRKLCTLLQQDKQNALPVNRSRKSISDPTYNPNGTTSTEIDSSPTSTGRGQ